MLVLSRKEGEQLVIGDNITLVISRISGNRVTIGIEAPKDVKIVRSELTSGAEVSTIGGMPKLHSVPQLQSMPQLQSSKSIGSKSNGLKEFAGSVLTLKRQVG